MDRNFTEERLENCANLSCPEVTINYVEVTGKEEIASKINAQIADFVIQTLYLGDIEEEPSARSIPEAVAQFIEMYEIHSAEFPDLAAAYFAELNISSQYQSSNLLSFEMRHYLYTGGAHGFGASWWLNIDPETGDELYTEDIVKDFEQFQDFVEEKFRIAYEITADDSINATGFWFEDEEFYIPETIGFQNDHLIIHYNQYDIASYAAGPIVLEIPLSEAAAYLIVK